MHVSSQEFSYMDSDQQATVLPMIQMPYFINLYQLEWILTWQLFIVVWAPDHMVHNLGNILISYGQDIFKVPMHLWRFWIPESVYLWWSRETVRSEPGKRNAGSPSESHQYTDTANGGKGSLPPYCDQARGPTPHESTIKRLLLLAENYFVIMNRDQSEHFTYKCSWL